MFTSLPVPVPGGLTRGGSWKARENKDRWLPGWAQNSKEGGEGEGKGAGPDEQPEGKNKVCEPTAELWLCVCVHVRTYSMFESVEGDIRTYVCT